MTTILFRLAAGGALIFLGRWSYHDPRRVHPIAFYSNPNSPALFRFTRVFAFLLILVGSFPIITIATERIVPGLAGVLVGLALSGVAAWYLRPSPSVTPASDSPVLKSGYFTKKGKWFISIGLIVASALALFILLQK